MTDLVAFLTANAGLFDLAILVLLVEMRVTLRHVQRRVDHLEEITDAKAST